jgi:fatty acid desaturase
MRDFVLHVLRIVVAGIVLAIARGPVAIAAALAIYFAAFALAHDLVHGSLGLGRRARWIALVASTTLILTAAHTMRRMHLRHHARPLADDDLEGAGARRSALGALFHGPANLIALRREARRAAPTREKRLQAVEDLLCLALILLGFVVPAVGTYVAIAVLLQATISFWGAHVPHHVPDWVVRVAERLAWTRSPVLLSLAFHDRHHAHPTIPSQQLADRSRSPRPIPGT